MIIKPMPGSLRAALAIIAGTSLAPAWGQTNEQTGAPLSSIAVNAAPAPLPERNASAATDEQLPTVVVVARRRSERSQDVPTAISSVSGEQLEAQGIAEVQNFQQLLPSLNAAYGQARQSSLAIRGIGNNPANEGLEPSVGIYLDNVFLGRPGMAVQDLVDIEQVDLLRGPQGTLFGKNTTAGVLNIQSRAPSFATESKLEASYGARNSRILRGLWSGALSERWAGRIVLARTDDEGWVSNLNDGRRLDSIDRYGLRGQLLYTADSYKLRLIADYAQEQDSQGSAVISGAGPARPHFRDLSEVEAATGADPSPVNPDLRQTRIDGIQRMHSGQGGGSAQLDVDWGDYTLSSISAWRFWNFTPHNDADFTNAPILDDYGVSVRDRQWSQELRLASPSDGRLDYVLGAYWFHQAVRNHLHIDFGPQADAGLLPTETPLATAAGTVWLPINLADGGYQILSNALSDSYGKVLTDSGALFAQGNWKITEQLILTAGLRGTYEVKTGHAEREEPVAAVRWTVPPFSNVQNAQIGPWNSSDYGRLRLHELSPSQLLTLSWQPASAQLLYATISHGEKSGGFNVNGVGSGPALGIESLKVAPERSNNLELGYKSSWLGQRLRANFNLFDTRVSDYQASVNRTVSGQALPVQVLTNVGKLESRGVEWDLLTLLTRGLVLSLNGSWNHAVYRSFDNAPCPAETNPEEPVSCSLSGQAVQGAPRWTVNSGLLYKADWRSELSQQFALNYAWRSAVNGSLDNSRYARIQAYGVLNASTTLQWTRAHDTLELSLWARNLLDQQYLLTAGAIVNAIYVGMPGTPRTLGATLRYRFP